jgi:hypothetical protein
MASLEILYLAFGYRYLVMAINSARSVRHVGTSCYIKLITNLPLTQVLLDDASPFDEIVRLKSTNRENRYAKIRILDFADGPKSLYLDCDTEVWFPLHRFAPMLSKFDIAMRPILPTPDEFEIIDGNTSTGMGLTNLNAGIMFIAHTPGSRELFKLWNQYFFKMGFRNDQPSFQRAFIDSGARIFPLGTAWNATPLPQVDLGFIRQRPEEVKILHYRDPVFWPAVGPNLAYAHNRAVLEFGERSAELETQIDQFSTIVRHYEMIRFRYKLGRRLIDWQMKRAASRRKGGPSRLRMKGERETPDRRKVVMPGSAAQGQLQE